MIWKTIPNFSNYEVSEYGDVRRSIHTNPRSRGWSRKKPGEHLAPAKKKYPTVMLVDDEGKLHTKRIHWLVAITFKGPKPKGLSALHENDDTDNNHYSNLYWGTQLQNVADKFRNGHALLGEKHPNCTISDKLISEIRELYSTGFFSQQAIATKFKMSQSAVSNFVNGKRRLKNVV